MCSAFYTSWCAPNTKVHVSWQMQCDSELPVPLTLRGKNVNYFGFPEG